MKLNPAPDPEAHAAAPIPTSSMRGAGDCDGLPAFNRTTPHHFKAAIVPTPIAAGVLDVMRAKTVSIQAGARTAPMDSQTLKIARQITDPVGGWRAENAPLSPESQALLDEALARGYTKVTIGPGGQVIKKHVKPGDPDYE